MDDDDSLTLRLKQLIKQIAGVPDPKAELFPEYLIKGKGIVYCLNSSKKKFVKLSRGISVFCIQENYDTQGRSLIYTYYGDLVLIEPEELEEIGFD